MARSTASASSRSARDAKTAIAWSVFAFSATSGSSLGRRELILQRRDVGLKVGALGLQGVASGGEVFLQRRNVLL